MLVSMLGADGGPPDKLLAVTRPLTGAYYVIPSADHSLPRVCGCSAEGAEMSENSVDVDHAEVVGGA